MSSRVLIALAVTVALAGCSTSGIGPHKIDVQQGNALDADNLSRLKPGLSRSQVRFLMGTPLVVDPFRGDRWDYIYQYRAGGKLTEQRRVTLTFDGDVLAKIDGDIPSATATLAQAATTTGPAEVAPTPDTPSPEAVALADPLPGPAAAAPVDDPAPATTDLPDPAAAPDTAASEPPPEPALPEPVPAEPTTPLIAETPVERLLPEAAPLFPEAKAGRSLDAQQVVLVTAVDTWANAWTRRDIDAYLAAYSERFLPQGGGSRLEWEKRRRQLLGQASNIEVRIESPSVEMVTEKIGLVSFDQFYRSDSYRDAVRKQLRLEWEDGRWKIVQERVVSILKTGQAVR